MVNNESAIHEEKADKYLPLKQILLILAFIIGMILLSALISLFMRDLEAANELVKLSFFFYMAAGFIGFAFLFLDEDELKKEADVSITVSITVDEPQEANRHNKLRKFVSKNTN